MIEINESMMIRTEKSGSLTGVTRYITHMRKTMCEGLRKLFTNQAVRTALCCLKLINAYSIISLKSWGAEI